jgi:hypothetical protein
MDIFFEGWQGSGHEAGRLSPATGSAPQLSGVALEARSRLSNRGTNGSIVRKLAGAVDAGVPAQRQGRLKAAAHAGASTAIAASPETGVGRFVKAWRARSRLSHWDLDQWSRRRANPPTLGHRLSSGARVENPGGLGLELSKARTARPATSAPENPGLEAAGLAANEKKPGGWEHIWFSSMKADFCSFRRCSALGLRWARRPCCGTITSPPKRIKSQAAKRRENNR